MKKLRWRVSPSSSPPAKPVTEAGQLNTPLGATNSCPGGRSSLPAWLPSASFCGVYWEKRRTWTQSWSSICLRISRACFQMKRMNKINQDDKYGTYVGCIYFNAVFILKRLYFWLQQLVALVSLKVLCKAVQCFGNLTSKNEFLFQTIYCLL